MCSLSCIPIISCSLPLTFIICTAFARMRIHDTLEHRGSFRLTVRLDYSSSDHLPFLRLPLSHSCQWSVSCVFLVPNLAADGVYFQKSNQHSLKAHSKVVLLFLNTLYYYYLILNITITYYLIVSHERVMAYTYSRNKWFRGQEYSDQHAIGHSLCFCQRNQQSAFVEDALKATIIMVCMLRMSHKSPLFFVMLTKGLKSVALRASSTISGYVSRSFRVISYLLSLSLSHVIARISPAFPLIVICSFPPIFISSFPTFQVSFLYWPCAQEIPRCGSNNCTALCVWSLQTAGFVR